MPNLMTWEQVEIARKYHDHLAKRANACGRRLFDQLPRSEEGMINELADIAAYFYLCELFGSSYTSKPLTIKNIFQEISYDGFWQDLRMFGKLLDIVNPNGASD